MEKNKTEDVIEYWESSGPDIDFDQLNKNDPTNRLHIPVR